jgi:hypothetical protein
MRARRTFLALATVAGLATLGSSQAAALLKEVQFFAVLSGGNEVGANGQAAAGDPDGHGTASVLFVGDNRICISALVNRLDKPTAAHIHEGPAGRNGPIVVPFTPPATGNPGTTTACVTVGAAVLGRLHATPTGFYINVHTAKFPDGAVRGQLF